MSVTPEQIRTIPEQLLYKLIFGFPFPMGGYEQRLKGLLLLRDANFDEFWSQIGPLARLDILDHFDPDGNAERCDAFHFANRRA